jgi:predicted dehydrogenase
MKTINWGILGPGNIARAFAEGIKDVPDAKIVAVGSHSHERSREFATEYGIEKAYGSYEELVNDPAVDVIYVATPHPFHKENTLLCLKAGKAVLCEKPFALNARDAQEVVDFARQKGLFLMEAMWTRFVPTVVKLREWISEGKIGEIRRIDSDFTFRVELDPKNRLFNLALGGGALLDVGIYPVSFVAMILGTNPVKIESMAHIGETGVDEQFVSLFQYSGGAIAAVSGAIRTDGTQGARIFGTLGSITVPLFGNPKEVTLKIYGKETCIFHPDVAGNGYNYEAQEVGLCLIEGKTESDIMPLDDTVAIMKMLDDIRKPWNLKYPE